MQRYTVYARYALLILAGYLASADVIPRNIADALALDPEVIELLASGFAALAALIWYHYSAAKKALKEWINDIQVE